MQRYRWMVIGIFVAVAGFAQEILTNDTIVRLLRAGTGESIILSMVDERPGRYTLAADAVIELKHAGASDAVIAAMMRRSESATSGGLEKPHDSAVAGAYTWSQSDPTCTSLVSNGQTVKSIHADGFTVLAALVDNGSKIQAYVGIANNTASNVDVRPEKFQVVVTAPKYRCVGIPRSRQDDEIH